jgi:hypothetical protein
VSDGSVAGDLREVPGLHFDLRKAHLLRRVTCGDQQRSLVVRLPDLPSATAAVAAPAPVAASRVGGRPRPPTPAAAAASAAPKAARHTTDKLSPVERRALAAIRNCLHLQDGAVVVVPAERVLRVALFSLQHVEAEWQSGAESPAAHVSPQLAGAASHAGAAGDARTARPSQQACVRSACNIVRGHLLGGRPLVLCWLCAQLRTCASTDSHIHVPCRASCRCRCGAWRAVGTACCSRRC